jgi:hypothetical protein
MELIEFIDFVLAAFYLIAIFLLALHIRSRLYPVGHPWRRWFLPGLMLKIFGATFIALVYVYYYGYGDTMTYFRSSMLLNSAMNESFGKWFQLLLHVPRWYEPGFYDLISQMPFYHFPATYIVVAVAAVVNLLTFESFLCTSILFAALSFSGMWALFRTFARQHPHLTTQVAIAVLCIPSVFVWGSGIFKDTLCLFGLGWLTACAHRLFIERRFSLFHVLMLLFSFYIIAVVKIYILLCFIPAMLVWIMMDFRARVKDGGRRLLLTYAIATVVPAALILLANTFSEILGNYALENVTTTAAELRRNIIHDSGEQGSSYDIGEIDPSSPVSMLALFPRAVNVALFRPYVWEVRNPLMLLNALESAAFMIIFLRVLFATGITGFFRHMVKSPELLFFLIFTLMFAFSVGLSTGNFGTLSRYRIPFLPFFLLLMTLVFYRVHDVARKRILWRF